MLTCTRARVSHILSCKHVAVAVAGKIVNQAVIIDFILGQILKWENCSDNLMAWLAWIRLAKRLHRVKISQASSWYKNMSVQCFG